MATLTIHDKELTLTEPRPIREFLQQYDILFDQWDCSTLMGKTEVSDTDLLTAFRLQIDELKRTRGYVTADVINVSPATPGLDQMLSKFSKEHTHSEDEVRFVVDGRGVFHINPVSSSVFSIEMFSGDLISVPAGTRHWFNLCSEKSIRTIRLFQDSTGWTPHYIDEHVHERYSSLCFSDIKSAKGGDSAQFHSKVQGLVDL